MYAVEGNTAMSMEDTIALSFPAEVMNDNTDFPYGELVIEDGVPKVRMYAGSGWAYLSTWTKCVALQAWREALEELEAELVRKHFQVN